jgi:predicted DCC family thiol-disulfide oxidoreductase YuxK
MTPSLPGSGAEVHGLTVLYDPWCDLCTHAARWLASQPLLVPMELVPAASPAARSRFPQLDHQATLRDLTVVATGGQVYAGADAWVMCLWATRLYRPLAERLARPGGRSVARTVAKMASRYRRTQKAALGGQRGGGCVAGC